MANRRGKVEVVTVFFFLGSKITAHSDCSHEIIGQLLLGRKSMTNLDSVLKTPCSQCRGPGSVPGQAVRAHVLQLKILHAATNAQCSQIHK